MLLISGSTYIAFKKIIAASWFLLNAGIHHVIPLTFPVVIHAFSSSCAEQVGYAIELAYTLSQISSFAYPAKVPNAL